MPAVIGVSFVMIGFRALALSQAICFASGLASALPAPDGTVPTLTNALQVLSLPDSIAARHCPVFVRGVMTFVDPHAGYGFVQDGTAGAVAFWTNTTPPVKAGQLVEVTGETATNVYAPIIGSARFQTLGNGSLPEPLKVTYQDLYTGHADCQWVEVFGKVRSASTNKDFLLLMLSIQDHRFSVSVLTTNETDPERWVGAIVRARGVACGSFNEKGLYVDAEMLSPSADQVRVVTAAKSNPYELPVTPVPVLGHKAEAPAGQRIHIQGVVTGFLPGDALYVRDDGASIEVQTAQTSGVRVGDRVDIIGFYERKEAALVIEDANYRRIAGGPPPEPVKAGVSDLVGGRLDAELVTLSARLLEWQHGPDVRQIELQSSNVIFRAQVAADSRLDELPAGSLVQVTGVCRVILDRNENAASFELHLRSPGDLVLLAKPSWWSARHIEWLSGALLVAGIFAMGWAVVLKHSNTGLEQHVAERTARLKEEIAERKRAEEALRQSEALYHSLVEHLPVLIYRKDREGRFIFANAGFSRFNGFSGDDILGQTAFAFLPRDVAENYARDDEQVLRTGNTLEFDEQRADLQGQTRHFHVLKTPVRNADGQIIGTQAMFTDITARKLAEAKLEQVHRELLQASRQAGMAEVATGVLHNVGNVLNSVNVSASLLAEKFRQSRVQALARVAALLEEHNADLGAYLTTDPRGKQLPGYVGQLAEYLSQEQAVMVKEVELIGTHIDHIKQIVAMQQSYARIAGVAEKVSVVDLVEDALRMSDPAFQRHGVEIVREFPSEAPEIVVDKHKVLQIIVNLMRNAKHACTDSARPEKRVTVTVSNGGERVRICVADNGVGIPAENLVRIFSHGFTTRKGGHGFGLHSGALAARQMGGTLLASSDGVGLGASFMLELPLRPPERGYAEIDAAFPGGSTSFSV